MIPLITPATMRDMEQRYFREAGVLSIDLMERAARELCDAILRHYGPNRTLYFACGPGGNGGDGYACARMYRQVGGVSVVFAATPPTSADAIENLRRAREAGVGEGMLESCPEVPDLWVDALYGTGLSRAPKESAAKLIERMNADRARGSAVVAVDIPSGLNGLTGRAFSPCVQADHTFTFQFAKPGCYLNDGLDMAGAVEVLDIGIPSAFFPDNLPALVDADDVWAFLPARPRNLHKGDCGHLLIVAGSFGMAGAAALCALSALRSGVGLVTVACPASIVPILQTLAPCAMCVPLPESDGAIADEAVEPLQEALRGKSAVACGCGLSRRASKKVLGVLMSSGLPTVFDADALNLIAEDEALCQSFQPHHLITPHPGEAARLLGRSMVEPLGDVLALKALNCQVLLKGATTVIPVGNRVLLSTTGGCGMAKGGSGDCLTGIVGALMAQKAARGTTLAGEDLALCAAIASEIHGTAGEIVQARRGVRGMIALDIVEALPEAFLRYE